MGWSLHSAGLATTTLAEAPTSASLAPTFSMLSSPPHPGDVIRQPVVQHSRTPWTGSHLEKISLDTPMGHLRFRVTFGGNTVDGLDRRDRTVLRLIVCSDRLALKTPA